MKKMRKRIQPLFLFSFFAGFIALILWTRSGSLPATSEPESQPSTSMTNSSSSSSFSASSGVYHIEDALTMKPILDLSGWQLPNQIDYDMIAERISGVIVRVQSGSHTKEDNNASDKKGMDKSYKTHIEEFQKRGIPVAVYAYVTGHSEKNMRQEAQSFYKAASPYKPTFYWLDVEEKTMPDMDAGVEAFRDELEKLGAQNIGIYIGTYFMEEHSITTDKFDSIWIPTYGDDSGYYNAAPNTDLDYDLHQYTSKGKLNGFAGDLDLNLITTLKDPNVIYQKLFTLPE